MKRACGPAVSLGIWLVLVSAPAVSQADSLYVGVASPTNDTVQQVLADGSVHPVAGTLITGLSHPNGLALDSAGNLYVAHEPSNGIFRITPGAGGSVFASSPNLLDPEGIAFDGSGQLFVADPYTGISKVAADGSVSLVVPHSSTFQPFGITFHNGDLFASSQDGTVRRISPTFTMSTYASGLPPVVWDLAFDRTGDLFVADAKGIERVAPDGSVSTFAKASPTFQMPIGLAFDSTGNLFAADYLSREVKAISATGGVTTLARLDDHRGTSWT